MKTPIAFVCVSLVLLASRSPLVAAGPAGAWRMTVEDAGAVTLCLVRFDVNDGKWTGAFLGGIGPLGSPPRDLKGAIESVRLDGDRIRFLITLDDVAWRFDGKAPGDDVNHFAGTLAHGDAVLQVSMDRSQLSAFDAVGVLREVVAQRHAGLAFYQSVLELLTQATGRKLAEPDVRQWADAAIQAAAPAGVRWQVLLMNRLVQTLLPQSAYHAVALDLARRAEQLLDSHDELALHYDVLDSLTNLLRSANRSDEARAAAERLARLEERGEREDAERAPVRPAPFAGRKTRSDLVVLVELFTSVDSPPCVAADRASDALAMAYRGGEVVPLRYHVNIPFPDPLTNPVTLERQKFYKVDGTPAVFVNGVAAPGGGGSAADAPNRLDAWRKRIDPMLDRPPGANLQLRASRNGERITVNARIRDLAKPDRSKRLRILLVERFVRLRGSNGLEFQRNVVRAAFGPEDGTVLANAASEHEYSLELPAVRERIATFLTEIETANPEHRFARRPMDLARLRVVAFVQDDATREVLQARFVDLP